MFRHPLSSHRLRWLCLPLALATLAACSTTTTWDANESNTRFASLEWRGAVNSGDSQSRLISDEWAGQYQRDVGPPSCHEASLHPDLNADRC